MLTTLGDAPVVSLSRQQVSAPGSASPVLRVPDNGYSYLAGPNMLDQRIDIDILNPSWVSFLDVPPQAPPDRSSEIAIPHVSAAHDLAIAGHQLPETPVRPLQS